MYLTGFGDPTNGHGGINYLKHPQKMSRHESNLQKKYQRNQPKEIVSGTRADLRGLNMEKVHKYLIKLGKKSEEVLGKLERWDKIDALRDLANRL